MRRVLARSLLAVILASAAAYPTLATPKQTMLPPVCSGADSSCRIFGLGSCCDSACECDYAPSGSTCRCSCCSG